jgi:hypothetical protein
LEQEKKEMRADFEKEKRNSRKKDAKLVCKLKRMSKNFDVNKEELKQTTELANLNAMHLNPANMF